MFSRRERDYLRSLASTDSPGSAFGGNLPSPGYRRKLEWSIRRKAVRVAADVELLGAAVEREPRLVGLETGRVPNQLPLYREPFAVLVHSLDELLRRAPHRQRNRARSGGRE